MPAKTIPQKIVYRDDLQLRKLDNSLVEKREVEFVISSEAIDSYRTVFVQDGADLGRFDQEKSRTGGIVMFNHLSFGSDPDNQLGVGYAYREKNQLIGRVRFEKKEINPKADTVFRKIQNGMPYMASIGARPLKMSLGDEEKGENPEVLYFRKWQLMEFSVVPIGANPDAQKRNLATHREIQEYARQQKASKEPIETKKPAEITSQSAQIIINQHRM